VSASTVAVVIGALAAEPWMPRISHWEIATTDEVWGAHAELDCKTSGPAFRELHALADKVGSAVTAVSGNLSAVDFVHDDVPVRVWWLRPGVRWIVPETCATCPTKLSGEPGARFVRLGEGDREAPVICVPCRDRMQREFVAGDALALREQLAARTFYLADVEGVDDGQSLHTTADAAKAWVEEIGGPDGDWFEQDGVWEQWHTHVDTDQPTSRSSGRVMPLMVQGDGILAEAQQIRQGFLERSRRADLLTEVRDSQRDEIRRLQTEQGRIMQALGCGQHDEWDEVVHRARRLAAGGAVSS
jgi:hypothetical protein